MMDSILSLIKGSFVIIAATTCYGLFGIFIALSKQGAETVVKLSFLTCGFHTHFHFGKKFCFSCI